MKNIQSELPFSICHSKIVWEKSDWSETAPQGNAKHESWIRIRAEVEIVRYRQSGLFQSPSWQSRVGVNPKNFVFWLHDLGAQFLLTLTDSLTLNIALPCSLSTLGPLTYTFYPHTVHSHSLFLFLISILFLKSHLPSILASSPMSPSVPSDPQLCPTLFFQPPPTPSPLKSQPHCAFPFPAPSPSTLTHIPLLYPHLYSHTLHLPFPVDSQSTIIPTLYIPTLFTVPSFTFTLSPQ